MRVGRALPFAAVVSIIALAFASCGAAARRLSPDDQDFRIVWSSLTFVTNISSESVSVQFECPVTLAGSFHSATLAKVVHGVVGIVHTASLRESSCTNGSVGFLAATLPWQVAYESLTGTLPRITGVTALIRGISLWITSVLFQWWGTNDCLWGIDGQPLKLDIPIAEGVAREVIVDGGLIMDSDDRSDTQCDVFDIQIGLEGVGALDDGASETLTLRLV